MLLLDIFKIRSSSVAAVVMAMHLMLVLVVQVSAARKQARANLFMRPFAKDRKWLLQPPSLPLPNLDIPLPFLRRLNALPHSTLGEDDVYHNNLVIIYSTLMRWNYVF